MRTHASFAALCSALSVIALPATPVRAQQPLAVFLVAADATATDTREALEAARAAGSAVDEARGRLFPTITASAIYTRNEREVVVNLPAGTAVITPYDQLDGRFTLTVPILDVSLWESFFAAEATADAAAERATLARDTVRMTVVTTWYSLVAARVLVRAAEATLRAAEAARDGAMARVEVGVTAAAEGARGEAEVARARQSLAEARLLVTLAAQSLEVTTGIHPDETEVALGADLGAPPPLDELVLDLDELPAVRAARADARAAERSRDAAWAALFPVVSGSASERVTNASGFGPATQWAIALTATWTFDFVRPFAIETREATLAGARVREEEARALAEAGIVEAWHRVSSLLERVAAASAELDASRRAAEDARARFEAGAGSQLEAILAERDRFSAEVGLIQATGDLAVARAALSIRSGRDPN